MTKRSCFWLFGSIAFLISTGWFVSGLVEFKTKTDSGLAQALTVRI
jgi:hypothetical protein